MAIGTQQQLYLLLGKAYIESIKIGAQAVELSIETLEEVLTYLNGSDNSRAKISKAPDDMTEEEFAALVKPAEKQPEAPKENTNGADGSEPVLA